MIRIPQANEEINADIAIVGGGMAGSMLACILASEGFRTVLVDREPPQARLDRRFDIRTTAISYGSRHVVEAAGIWDMLAPDASPIEQIRIADGATPVFLHFHHHAVEGRPFGWIVENRLIRQALADRLEALDVPVFAPAVVSEWRPGRLVLEGATVTASLVVGADGRHSTLRHLAGIEVSQREYGQTSLVFIVAHEHPHGQVAVEHFQPAGPFAVLPMTGDDGLHRSSVVWTVQPTEAERLMALDDAAFDTEIAPVFADYWGATHVLGGRAAHKLSLTHARHYVAERLALVGDSAHAIHPIAGQGLNLGLRDIALLAELLVDAGRLGLDIGAAGLLARYQRERRGDNTRMVAATDTLNRLFSNDVAPVRLARVAGLAAIQQLPAVKRFFMLTAMGVTGTPPKLIRGENL
jgi:2-octaprenyl-6-methoxyphenol hydroxylase